MAGGGSGTEIGSTYSRPVAFIYMFNLIVGAGSLTLPLAFYDAGLILGLVFLGVCGFFSYVTVTFVVELMGSANALMNDPSGPSYRPLPTRSSDADLEESLMDGGDDDVFRDKKISTSIESQCADISFEIRQRPEMGLMTELFLGPAGKVTFYVVLIVYLFGDLSIYAASVPKTLATTTGGFSIGSWDISEGGVYYFYVALFAIIIVPWCFFNFQKTKYLQYTTMGIRNLGFFIMVILSFIYLSDPEIDERADNDIPWFDFSGISTLFGVSIYSFMCHHSLPSIVSPINNKDRMPQLVGGVFTSVYTAYAMLCVAALLAFGPVERAKCQSEPGPACKIQDLFTLNFESYNIRFFAYFLSLFPVFTLASNFPMIAITLRNNIKTILPGSQDEWWHNNYFVTLLTVGPPFCIAFATDNVEFLVKITGAYAGLGIMLIFPSILILTSRKIIFDRYGYKFHKFTTPFKQQWWPYLILTWSAIAVVYNLYSQIDSAVN